MKNIKQIMLKESEELLARNNIIRDYLQYAITTEGDVAKRDQLNVIKETIKSLESQTKFLKLKK